MQHELHLFTANLDSFFIKFLIPQLKYFKENGYEVHVASKDQGIEINHSIYLNTLLSFHWQFPQIFYLVSLHITLSLDMYKLLC